MVTLPPADYKARCAALLDSLGVQWVRTEVTETCPDKPLCETCRDRRRGPEKGNGVSYQVLDGILRGRYVSWEANADELVFEELARRLNEAWSEHLRTCSTIGKVLRSVAR